MNSLAAAMVNGTTFLATQQLPNGSFISYSSPAPSNFKTATPYHTVFINGLLLSCLTQLGETQSLQQIKKKLAHYLLSQKSDYWSYNYWDRSSDQYTQQPYPDDLDDTFCALNGLYQFHPQLFDGTVLAHITNLLIQTERSEGGPYQTWLVPDTAPPIWRDVDVAVNSNIAYFLSFQGITLPGLDNFLAKKIREKSLTSPYYPSSLPVLYYLSRFYKGVYVPVLIKLILDHAHMSTTPLVTALVTSSLVHLNWQGDYQPWIESLYASQHQSGSWDAYGFCFDPTVQGVKHYAGSAALTTALCLEALAKSTRQVRRTALPLPRHVENRLISTIEAAVRRRYEDTGLKESLNQFLTPLLAGQRGEEVMLLAHFFNQSLVLEKRQSRQLIKKLGVINVFGWIAYTIYDAIRDGEGDGSLLPLANIALREVELQLAGLSPDLSWQRYYRRVLDTMSKANHWELINCRFSPSSIMVKDIPRPDFSSEIHLYQHAFGHALGCLFTLYANGYRVSSRDFKAMESFFQHVLAARQLHDDAHDWEHDLKHGLVNSVAALLLTLYKPKKRTLTLEEALPHLRLLFWQESVVIVCDRIDYHLAQARAILNRRAMIQPTILSNLLLDPLAKATSLTRSERSKTVDFIATYAGLD